MPYYPQSDALVLPAPILSYRNILGRNGGLEVWQRGAGGAAVFVLPASSIGVYTADGWAFTCGVNQATNVQRGGGDVNGSNNSAIIIRNSGQTGTAVCTFEFPLDTDEVALARGQIVTLSWNMRIGSGWTSVNNEVTGGFYVGTGTPAKRALAVYTNETVAIQAPHVVTTTAARYSLTSSVIVPVNATQGSVAFTWSPTGTAGGQGLVIDDVQLEIGSVATPFERRPFESELLACQRHYWKTFLYSMAPAQNTGVNTGDYQFMAAGAVSSWTWLAHPVRMRGNPTLVSYNPQAANNQARCPLTSNDCTGTNLSTTDRGIQINTVPPAGVGVGNPIAIHFIADAGI